MVFFYILNLSISPLPLFLFLLFSLLSSLTFVLGYVNVFFIEMNNAVFVDSNITCQLGYYSVVSLINNTYLATSQFTNDQLYSYGMPKLDAREKKEKRRRERSNKINKIGN